MQAEKSKDLLIPNDNIKMEKEVAKILLKIKAVILKPDKPFTWVSGIKSPIYCDNRLLISYPEEREKIIDYYIEIIERSGAEFDVIAGTATSGIAFASWIAQKMNKPMVYIKKKTKGYGTDKLVEGVLEKGARVIVIEDLISTGESSMNAVQAVRNEDGIVDFCYAIFTYEFKKSIMLFKENKCNLINLSNFSALVDAASKEGYMKDDEKNAVLEWSKNPDRWRK